MVDLQKFEDVIDLKTAENVYGVLKLSENKDRNNCSPAIKTKYTWINGWMRKVPNNIISKSHNNNLNNSTPGITSFGKLNYIFKIK